MKAKSTILVFFLSLFLIHSCSQKENSIFSDDKSVIIDAILYNQTKTDNYNIIDVKLNDNLLTIKIASSGCSSNSWKAVLVDSGAILESNPPQRNIKLSLENNEACLAVFEREFAFDISVLKENYPEIILNLEKWNTQIK